MSGVKPEIWTNVMVRDFERSEAESFLSRIPSYNRYVRSSANGLNEAIHLVDVGADPEVLINNSTYPINAVELPDGDISISLDKYQTEVTIVTDDELQSIAYDKIRDVQGRHTRAIDRTKHNKAVHALAPASHGDKTPVVTTSGTNDGTGRARITKADILKLKKYFDDMELEDSGRILVLTPDHISDLLAIDESWEKQFYDIKTGKVHGNFMGFEVFRHTSMPYFDSVAKEKKSFGSVPTAGDYKASVAFYAPDMFRANGSTNMYYDKAKNNPRTQQSEMNYRHNYVTLPRKQRAIGAIVSKDA